MGSASNRPEWQAERSLKLPIISGVKMQSSELELKRFLRGWWLFAFTGLQLIASGIWIGLKTDPELGSLIWLFAFVYLGNGASEIAFAAINRRLILSWIGILVLGIFEFLLGLLLLASPPKYFFALVAFVSIWLLSRGVLLFLTAVDVEALGQRRSWMAYAIAGLAATGSGLLVFIQPGLNLRSLIVWTVLGTVATGAFFILYAIQLRNARSNIEEVGQKLRRMKNGKVS